MKTKISVLIAAGMMSLPVWADVNLEPFMNKVTVQLTANQWVTTKTALVNVAVNAAVTDQGIEKIQNNVLNRLNDLAKSEWHIVSFNRSQDKSGLESVQIYAEARLPQAELGNIRNNAKNMSKPGETYTIDNVQFTPSDEEVREGNTLLRSNIYDQVNAEIATLNKKYPDQKFYLNRIDFGSSGPVVMQMAQNQMYFKANVAVASAPAPLLNVGNKIELQANVVLASMPAQLPQVPVAR